MILIFRNFFNSDLKNLYENFLSLLHLNQHRCPYCNASCSLVKNGHYFRHCIMFISNTLFDTPFEVQRVKCKECGKTHALLPDCVIPYYSYSYGFIICVLCEYYLEPSTVEEVCDKFQISPHNLYHWKRIYDKQRVLCALVAQIQANKTNESILNYIKAQNPSAFLLCFFNEHRQPFLHDIPTGNSGKGKRYIHHMIYAWYQEQDHLIMKP